ncbi:transposase [Novosphingobium umbonatum]|uniref:transposase n=1 Tax=Novosphingobium umbonatum TaxID=1908524 RepID=UPI003CCC5340
MEFMIRDRLSWLRFLGLALWDRMPDENTIRHFRNRLTENAKLARRARLRQLSVISVSFRFRRAELLASGLPQRIPKPRIRHSIGGETIRRASE